MFKPTEPLKLTEFVVLLAMMVSIMALSTDAMLPALDEIGRELGLADPNEAQLVITAMFLGFAFGQMVAGPLSDSFGRKPVIYIGYVIFIAGCVLSLVATDFEAMLIGRVFQGLGGAAPRIISIALVRDGYEGRAMARIMSIVMAIFILVPAIAPAIGQGMMYLAGWRSIFAMLLVMAVTAYFWFALRQPETLAPEARKRFSLRDITISIGEILRYRALTGYTVASGLVFGAFVGYLNSAQQVFEGTYETGDLFSVYFGIAALAIGAASVFNSKVVIRLGMRYMAWWALVVSTIVSGIFLVIVFFSAGVPGFFLFMTWLIVTFFCMGILFGNFNAMAMEPVGHVAGLGAAVVGSLSTFISLPLGWFIGVTYDGTITSLIAGFAVLSGLTLILMLWIEKGVPSSVPGPQES